MNSHPVVVLKRNHTRTKENHADGYGQCQLFSLKETSVNQEQQGCLRGSFWYLNSFSALATHTCPLPSECQSPVYDDIDLCSTILHGHLYLLKTGLQWRLSSRETSGHWSDENEKKRAWGETMRLHPLWEDVWGRNEMCFKISSFKRLTRCNRKTRVGCFKRLHSIRHPRWVHTDCCSCYSWNHAHTHARTHTHTHTHTQCSSQ